MYPVLSTRRLSFDSSQAELIQLAVDYEFAGVEPLIAAFAEPAEADRHASRVTALGLRWGPASLPETLGPETGDDRFDVMLETLRSTAPQLHRAGVTTVAIWLRPAHDELSFADAEVFYRRRLNALSPILRAHELRLALEYVGPATWRRPYRNEFVHTLAGLRELLDKVADPASFGVVLDTFHWHTAHETAADIGTVDDVLAVDLNDAIPGVSRDDQLDLERAQPGATGVIDVDGFLAALTEAGYSGPVHSEPFSSSLSYQPHSQRVAESRQALRTVLAPSEIRRYLTGSGRQRDG